MKQIINQNKSFPISSANVFKNLVFTSGQIGMDFEEGKLVSDEIESQTKQALVNLENVLLASDSDKYQVLKTTVFLSDMSNYEGMNTVYADFFEDKFPARSAMAVKELPAGALVEVECIAIKK